MVNASKSLFMLALIGALAVASYLDPQSSSASVHYPKRFVPRFVKVE